MEKFEEGAIHKFRTLIHSKTGISFGATNISILESRIRQKLKDFSFERPDEYYRVLLQDEEEQKKFFDFVTTNLTYFYRNPRHYEALINSVIPELVKRKAGEPNPRVKLWSAGCSTGEEPYTNAMVLKEHLPPNFKISIVASDLSIESLSTASKATYKAKQLEGLPELYRNKYLTKITEEEYKIKEEVSSLIRFDYHNLLHESTLNNMDIIFCRNVLIYFDQNTQETLANRFYGSLRDKGYLFIGHSESLLNMDTGFSLSDFNGIFIYTKGL